MRSISQTAVIDHTDEGYRCTTAQHGTGKLMIIIPVDEFAHRGMPCPQNVTLDRQPFHFTKGDPLSHTYHFVKG